MKKIIPSEYSSRDLHHRLIESIMPRPIAFASTIDKKGKANLSPFSFFNAFGVNPSTLIFSPSRRSINNSNKHTFDNIREVPEVVINVVTYEMVEQMSLSSADFEKGINEFVKSGLTMLESDFIKPFRVQESPVQFECKVRDVIETGKKGGAANLIICEILAMHIDEKVMDKDGSINYEKIQLIGRLGKDYYCKAFGDGIFEVQRPKDKKVLGVDRLPENIRSSKILTGNDLGKLGKLERLPDKKDLDAFANIFNVESLPNYSKNPLAAKHKYARLLIAEGKVELALKLLLL